MACGAAVLASLLVAACGGGGESDGYGAIAVSNSTGRVAMASEALTQSIANDEARDECDAGDCTVVLQFEECGAISSGRTSGGGFVYGVAASGTAFDAQSAANNACTAKGGVGCATIPNLPALCN
ncbi:DUF4189 domain-containing protein [Hydrogenophaga sp. A37]|uniref:DUF4189 domain-containing protein n=1 Tax=Hydrogenophaga sp. A37 TaxID=1945864 RepID=UPI0025B76E76|nr:DUF4189 domain-containing protein [Hydrogenophaga sp. A37]